MEIYGNLKAVLDVRYWVIKALDDGWDISTLNPNEEVTEACRLSKDGFKAMVIMRVAEYTPWRHEAKIFIWDREGLSIVPPFPEYSMQGIIESMHVCSFCGRKDVTVRVGFADRACESCAVTLRPKIEKDGRFLPWNE